MVRYLLIASAVILALSAVWWAYLGSIPAQNVEQQFQIPANWKVQSENGIAFYYPPELAYKYISPVDWPPKVQVLNGSFTCTEGGNENQPAGKTERQTIGGRQYCVTRESQGAAGSIYAMYAYATPMNDRTVIYTFSLRFVQCGNYPPDQMAECNAERQGFSITPTVDLIARSAKTE